MAKTDRQKQLQALVEEMPAAHIQCRDYGHSWMPHTVIPLKGGGHERWRRCTRCQSRRMDLLDRSYNYATKPRYEYADGYVVKELGRLSAMDRCDIRRASIQETRKQ